MDISAITLFEDSIANSLWDHIFAITNRVRKKLKQLLDTQKQNDDNINDIISSPSRSNSRNNCVKWELISDIDCRIMTRLSKKQIIDMATKYALNPSDIFIVLSICKSNLSVRVASTIFGFGKTSIENKFHHVMDTLEMKMVPKYLGSAWTRAKITLHTPQFAKNLFKLSDNQIAYTCDGFPIYIEKSGDFDFQKLTYSGKSKRNCLTFHGCVTLDGSFIYINGPYGSDGYNNDQNIFDSLFDRDYNCNSSNSNNSDSSSSNNNDNNNNSNSNSNNNNINDAHSCIYNNDEETIHLSLEITQNGDVVVLDKGIMCLCL